MRRVVRTIAVIAGVGLLVALAGRGFGTALGFAAGAAISWLNFHWLHGLVEALGPGGRPLSRRKGAVLVLRYPLLALAGYVIVKFFALNVIAVLVGLFVPVAAVIAEILYELIYA